MTVGHPAAMTAGVGDTSDENSVQRSLPWWTWVAALPLFHLCTWGSIWFDISPGVSVWYLPVPVGIVLVHWWGPRVLPALYVNAMFSVPLWDLPLLWAPVYALPETVTVALSWFLFTKWVRGQCQLPDVKQTVSFVALGILVPVGIGGIQVQIQLAALGELPTDQFWPAALTGWIGDMLGCLAVAVPALMFLTEPLRQRGWAGLSDEAGRVSRYLFIRGRPWSRAVVVAALVGIVLASTVVETSFVLAGYALFVLAAALSGGAGAAALTGSLAVLLTLPFRAALVDEFPAWWAGQAMPFSVNLQLLILCTGALITGRAISDLTSETDRRRQSEAAWKESEIRFRDFAGAASDLFWETGPDFRFLWVSENLSTLVGISRSRPLAKTRWEFAGADPNDPAWAGHIADMEAHRPFRDFRYSIHSDAGDLVWFSISGVPLFDDDGGFRGYRGTATNITAETMAQQALAESKALLDTAVESIADGFALFDPDDRLVLSNAKYRDAMSDIGATLAPGLRFEDMIRRAVSSGHIVMPPGVEPDMWVAERLREHGTPGTIRSFWTADGRWIEVREYAAADGYLALLRVDATDRKRMEETVRESEARLREAQRIAHLGTWEWDIETGAERWSEETSRIIGFDPPPSKPTFQMFLDAVVDEDRSRLDEAIRVALEDDEPYEVELRIVRKDGSIRTVEGRGIVHRDAMGQPERMTGTILDITDRRRAEQELRESEAQLREAQSIAHVGSWEWDIASDDEKWSDELNRIVGIDPPLANPSFKDFLGMLHPDDRQRASDAAKAALDHDVPYQMEYRVVRPDGTLRYVESRGIVQRDAADRAVRMTGTVFDRTDQKLAEEQLRHARSQKAIGDLASGIAHEINNLLQPIMTLTNLTRSRLPPDDPAYEDLGIVVDASERARDLVKQVLTYSRPDRSAMSVGPIAEMAAAPLDFLRATVPSTVDFITEIDGRTGDVDADPAQISTLLINLVSNSVDALGGRTGEIAVEVGPVHVDKKAAKAIAGLKPGAHAKLSVSDTGCGMDDATVRRIFDPFFTTKPVGEGTGLGLAAVQGIVDAHGGAVAVTSAPGKGTNIDAYLPLVTTGSSDKKPASPA